MKVQLLPVALAILSLASISPGFADSHVPAAGINDASQMGLRSMQFLLPNAAGLGGNPMSHGNGFTFEADPKGSTLIENLMSSSSSVNLLHMTSNNGPSIVSEWKLPVGEAISRDAKTSGLFRVPEPTTIALFFAGVGTLLLFRRRRRRML